MQDPYDLHMWQRVRRASIALMVLCIVGFVGTLVWHGFGGDSDKYGRMAVPGSGTVTLPEGEVEIHFAVRLATNGSGGALTVPSLQFSMEAPEGARDPVVTEDIGGTVIVNTAAHVRVWKLQVTDAGDYSVTTDGRVGGYIDPQLTFGRESWMPAWPAVVFAVVFVVALGLLLVVGRGSEPGRRCVVPTQGRFGDGPLRVAVLRDAEHQHPGAGAGPAGPDSAADRPAQVGRTVRRRVRSREGPARWMKLDLLPDEPRKASGQLDAQNSKTSRAGVRPRAPRRSPR